MKIRLRTLVIVFAVVLGVMNTRNPLIAAISAVLLGVFLLIDVVLEGRLPY
ncbi:MAG: hypothetical protein J7L55_04350 [Desulfurococcales archaeon]|nr:hypothetical protein [Desulfurococcales archaeon]